MRKYHFYQFHIYPLFNKLSSIELGGMKRMNCSVFIHVDEINNKAILNFIYRNK